MPVITYYILLARFGQNIPNADDFQASLNFIYAFFFTGKNPQEQWALLIAQHNEHRILVSRLLTLSLYRLTGQVNLLTILWVQQLFWVTFVALIARLGQSGRVWQSVWRGLPVVCLLFHPNTYDTLLNVWGGSQTYPVLLFTTGSLYALHQHTIRPRSAYWYGIAVVAAGLATFSFGSGFLAWAGGALYLFLSRRFAVLSGWLLLAALTVGAYLWHYERPLNNSLLVVPAGFARGLAILKFILLFPGASFMTIWSSPVWALPNLLLCYSLGLAGWVYSGHLLLSGYGNRNPFLFSLLAVSLATCLLLALGRGSQGTMGALISRYQLFANTIPLTLYLIRTNQRPVSGWPVYCLSLLLCVVQVQTLRQRWPVLARQYNENATGLAQWVRYRTPTLAIEARQQASAGEQLDHCLQTGIFVPSPGSKP